MPNINPYLTFNGNCEEAFNFYKSVFGGDMMMMRFSDVPPTEGHEVSAADAKRVMHVSLPIGKGTVLMGSDSSGHYGPVTMGTNFSIALNVDSQEDADRCFAALSNGGSVMMAMDKTFWNAYFGMCKDMFGIDWMISYELGEH